MIGAGAGVALGTGELAAAALGIVVVSALWWLWFDIAATMARARLIRTRGLDQIRLALCARAKVLACEPQQSGARRQRGESQ